MKAPVLGRNFRSQPVAINIDRLIETRMLVQANSGAGKSWALRRLLEQTHGRVQHLVIDVEDEFHTLREKFDYVLAGRHGGDCPADVRSAPLLARRLLELGVSSIIGIFELKHHERIQFVKLFLESLVNAPRDLWHPTLVVIDEAHMFCPEKDRAESASAVIDLMTRGRKRGFCGVLATQRIAKLNKDAAAEANNKLIGRSALDVDMKRAADELGFTSREQQAQLRSLQPGQFFAFGPAISDRVIEITVGPVETTHPKAGQRSAPPAPPRDTVRKVLAQLADLPQEAAEEAKTAGELRQQVKTLEQALRSVSKPIPQVAPVIIQRVEVSILKDSHVKALDALAARFEKAVTRVREFIDQISGVGATVLSSATTLRQLAAPAQPVKPQPPVAFVTRPPSPVLRTIPPNGNGKLNKGERVILNAIAQYPDGATSTQLMVLTGYKGTSRYEYTRKLTAAGYVQENGGRVFATDEGIAVLGSDFKPLPTGAELRDHWLRTLPEGERKIFQAVLDANGQADKETIESVTGYKGTSVYEYTRKLLARRILVQVSPGVVKVSEEMA